MSTSFTTTAHSAATATDKIPALQGSTKGHLTPAKLLDYINDTNAFINVKDPQFGATGDGATNDYAAIQAAIDYAEALSPRSATIFFPPGTYLVGTSPQVDEGKGINVVGCGPDLTKIQATGTNAAWTLNGSWRGKYEGVFFTRSSSRSAGGATFEYDADIGGSTIGGQGMLFERCLFSANLQADYAFAICNTSGGSGQGSENTFLNCAFYSGNEISCAVLGGNALQNTFITCNFPGHKKYAVKVVAGSAHLYSCGFQSTYSDHLTNGCGDIGTTYTAGSRMIIDGCRSESFVFFVSSGSGAPALIRGCNTSSLDSFGARANSTAYDVGQLYVGTTAAGRKKLYKVTTAGTTGGSAPTWPETGTVADGTAVWTEQSFAVVSAGGEVEIDGCRFPIGQVAGNAFVRNSSFGRFDAQQLQSGVAWPILENCWVDDSGGVGPGNAMTIEGGEVASRIAGASYFVNRKYKAAGKMIWDRTNARWMVATGPATTDTWVSIGPNNVGTVVTPA